MTNETMIITGASKGLGRTLSVEAHAKGYALALIARSEEALLSLIEELSSNNKALLVSTHVCDLTDANAVSSAFSDILTQHSHIKALINNAATWTGGKGVLELTESDIKTSMDLNFFSAFHCITALLKHWEESKQELHIINIGATASLRGGKNTFAFAAAKSSLRILTQSMARELGPEGVHAIHVILDGLINNERTKQINPDIPEEKLMDMSHIAKTLLFLCEQPKSAWTLECDLRPYTETF